MKSTTEGVDQEAAQEAKLERDRIAQHFKQRVRLERQHLRSLDQGYDRRIPLIIAVVACVVFYSASRVGIERTKTERAWASSPAGHRIYLYSYDDQAGAWDRLRVQPGTELEFDGDGYLIAVGLNGEATRFAERMRIGFVDGLCEDADPAPPMVAPK